MSTKQCTKLEKNIMVLISVVINMAFGALGFAVVYNKPIPKWAGYLLIVLSVLGVIVNLIQFGSGHVPGCA